LKNPKDKTVIIICGPTAVGKTSVSIVLAKYFHTEIISADSRQCFKELKIGVARPSDEELKEIPHHFIGSNSIKEDTNAAFFEKLALQKVEELFKTHDIIIMVGGTGLYIKAFCEGLDDIPPIDEAIRKNIIKDYELNGLSWLQEQVRITDPKFYKVGEIQNPHRLMRALEVVESTGQSILSFRKNNKILRPFNLIKIGLELPKEELHENINSRVDKMLLEGLVEEVSSLKGYRDVNALQTVGYSEIFEHLDGKMSLANAIEEIKKNTRKYAKRQMTWFKKDKEIKWINAKQTGGIVSMAQKLVQTERK
jgi:tRNA dimethylallyltransferase